MDPETDPLGKTVLLVDSNQSLAAARARRLRLYGITVHTADSVEAARDRLKVKESAYHLVLLAPRENPEGGHPISPGDQAAVSRAKSGVFRRPSQIHLFHLREERDPDAGSAGHLGGQAQRPPGQRLMPQS